MPRQPIPSKRPDRTVACRVTPEQYHQVLEAARAADQDISHYVRDTLFAATEATAQALDDAYAEGVRDAQAAAQHQRDMIEAERDHERQLRAGWQQRAGQLERELSITSARLTSSVVRVLENGLGARTEVLRLWALLDPSEQERMLPTVATAIVEGVHTVCRSSRRSDLKHVLGVDHRARWLAAILTLGSGEGEGSDARARKQVTGLALCAAVMVLSTWYLERAGYLLPRKPPDPSAVPEPPPVDVAQSIGDRQTMVADVLVQRDAIDAGDEAVVFTVAPASSAPGAAGETLAGATAGDSEPNSAGASPPPTPVIDSQEPTAAREVERAPLPNAGREDGLPADSRGPTGGDSAWTLGHSRVSARARIRMTCDVATDCSVSARSPALPTTGIRVADHAAATINSAVMRVLTPRPAA
jgi:hypothetical protein